MHKSAPLCLLILGLSLTACNNGGTPAPVEPPPKTDFVQPTAIEGTVQVISVGNTATMQLRSKDGLTTLSSAPIKALNGQFSFSLPLPSAALSGKLESFPVAQLYQSLNSSGLDCTGTIQISDLLATGYSFSELQLVDGTTVTKLSSITASSTGDFNEISANGWFYSLSSVSVTGTRSCPSGQKYVANVHLKPGWNALQFNLGKSGGSYQSVDPTKTLWRSTSGPVATV